LAKTGVVDYLVKPYEPEQILQSIEHHLNG